MPARSSHPASTPSQRRNRGTPKTPRIGKQVVASAQPLVHLHAHWTTQAHPRYLEAAAFHWPN